MLTSRSVGEVQGQPSEVDVGVIVATDRLDGLQAVRWRALANLAINVACCPSLREELLGTQALKNLPPHDRTM